MKEKIYSTKKNGMVVLLAILALYVLDIAVFIISAANDAFLPIIITIILFCLLWIPLCGLKVIKPQEAIVLTLFGNYIGTIREPGFYFVNPFCTAVNPAAKTKLGQSGDVDKAGTAIPNININTEEIAGKKCGT